MEHTKGKLRVSGDYIISPQNVEDYITICRIERGGQNTAKELVRRWNGYEEIVNRCGEIGVERDVAIGELAIIKQQRDDLLVACTEIS